MKELSDLKVGDWVYSSRYGWNKIVKIKINNLYSILIGKGRSFINNGREEEDDEYPSLFTFDPINGTEPEIDWDKVPFGTHLKVYCALSTLHGSTITVFLRYDNDLIYYASENVISIQSTNVKHVTIENPKEEWLK